MSCIEDRAMLSTRREPARSASGSSTSTASVTGQEIQNMTAKYHEENQ